MITGLCVYLLFTLKIFFHFYLNPFRPSSMKNDMTYSKLILSYLLPVDKTFTKKKYKIYKFSTYFYFKFLNFKYFLRYHYNN